MIKSVFSIFIFSLLLLCGEAFAAPSIKSYTLEQDGKNKNLVIKISEKAEFKVFTLTSPNRLIVDIKGGDTSSAKVNFSLDESIFGQVRQGKPEKNTLRVVFDLKKPIKITDSYFDTNNKKKGDPDLVVEFIEKSGRKIGDSKTAGDKTPKSMTKEQKEKIAFAPKVKDKPKAINYKPVIVIDAGHGGIDPGAISRRGIKEKNITLKYAKALKKELENTKKYRVFLTRRDDKFIKLSERVERARKAKGDLFISLHADSHPDPDTRGLSVYTISSSRAEKEAGKLLTKADKEEVINGVNMKKQSDDVQHMLIKLAQRETTNNSSEFASILVKELGSDARLLENPHRSAGFAVLTGADVPSVLMELGYLTNRHEEKLLQTGDYQKKLVIGIRDAIEKYFEKNPPTF